jgi:hypothetical protein
MSTDLVAESPSAHHLVLALFVCEAGLFRARPLHPEGQYHLVVEGLASVQTRIMSANDWVDADAIRFPGFKAAPISRWEDAQFFRLICRRFAEPDCVDLPEDDKVVEAVYPLVGSLIQQSPEIRTVLESAIREEIDTHGERGRNRIESALGVFGIRKMIDLDAPIASRSP